MKPKLHVLKTGDERLLIARLRAGEPEAFQALHHRYFARVLALTTQLLRSREAAEDAAQEVWLRVLRHFPKFRGDAQLSTWIHRIAVNVCFTEIKRSEPVPEDAEPPAPQSPEAITEERQLATQLESLLRTLGPKKHATFYLHYVEGLTGAELADVLDESRDAVLKRLQRTKQELLAMWRKKSSSRKVEQR